jgi:predicted  nucleic acid-binding Zn-ribbon protein
MSLADQIAEMEEELEEAQRECSKQRSDLYNLETDLADVQSELEEAYDFIAFIDKTNPELRVAYDAVKVLEGNKNG